MNATTQELHPHMPTDPDFLQSAARVSLYHAFLDYSLRLFVKSITNTTLFDALDATEYTGSQMLRKRIRRLAKRRFGDGQALVMTEALLQRCAALTAERNALVHQIVARDAQGNELMRGAGHKWEPLPPAKDVEALADRISALAVELNHVRLNGWFAEALSQTKLPRPGP